MHASAHGREAPRAGPAHLFLALSEDPDSPLETSQSLARTGLLTLAAVALLSAPPLFWAGSSDAAASQPLATLASKDGAPGGGDDGPSGDDPDGTTAPGQTTSTVGGNGGTSSPGTSAPGVTTAPGETSEGGATTGVCPPGLAGGGSTTIGQDTSTGLGQETSDGGHGTATTVGETASGTDVEETGTFIRDDCPVPPEQQPPEQQPPGQQPPPPGQQPPPPGQQPPPTGQQPPPPGITPPGPPGVTPPGLVPVPRPQPQPQPPAVLPSRAESPVARLAVPAGCPPQVFYARVRGRSIARVSFTIDGRRVATLSRPDAAGVWKYRINTRKYSVGRHRLIARVSFDAAGRRTLRQAGEPRVRVLTVTFAKCAREASRPKFTG